VPQITPSSHTYNELTYTNLAVYILYTIQWAFTALSSLLFGRERYLSRGRLL